MYKGFAPLDSGAEKVKVTCNIGILVSGNHRTPDSEVQEKKAPLVGTVKA